MRILNGFLALMPVKALAIATAFTGLLLGMAGICIAEDFYYVVNPPHFEVSPDVLPNGLPYCSSSSLGSLICYSPSFVRTAYNFPSNLDGTGQTIVIVDAFGSPTIQNDLAVFDSLFGIPAPPSFTVLCPDGCPSTSFNNSVHGVVNWALETRIFSLQEGSHEHILRRYKRLNPELYHFRDPA